jgi:hypothetical protein
MREVLLHCGMDEAFDRPTAIDLVIVQARTEDAASPDFAQAVLAGARSAVLVLR